MIFMQTLDSGCRRYQWTVLHTGLFSPSIIFAPLNLQMVQTHFKFTQTWLCLKEDNLRNWNSHNLKFAADNNSERSKNKTGGGKNIFLYTVIQYINGTEDTHLDLENDQFHNFNIWISKTQTTGILFFPRTAIKLLFKPSAFLILIL